MHVFRSCFMKVGCNIVCQRIWYQQGSIQSLSTEGNYTITKSFQQQEKNHLMQRNIWDETLCSLWFGVWPKRSRSSYGNERNLVYPISLYSKGLLLDKKIVILLFSYVQNQSFHIIYLCPCLPHLFCHWISAYSFHINTEFSYTICLNSFQNYFNTMHYLW